MRFLIFLLLGLLSFSLMANEPVSTSLWSNTAIGGYDSMSYHTAQAEANRSIHKGQSRYTVQWNGADWHFATPAAAERFAQAPEQYVPKYNGHCANALSLQEGLIPTSGAIWEFFADELYLFYAERGRQRWLQGDWETYQTQAESAWQAIIKS